MRRALLTLVMSAGLLWAAAVPAGAGGPTSVLVASPGQAAATALYYTDPRYSELEGLLHGPGSEVGETGQPAADTYFTLTWLVHDVTPWRIDSLALDESGGAWLATRMDTIGEEVDAEVGEGDETWTRLSDGQQIRRLIGSLGLLGHGKAARGGDREVPVPMDVIGPILEAAKKLQG